MFNLFGKRDSANDDLGMFQNSFTRKQKAAIISVLIIFANSDGKINPKEEAQIHSNLSLLNFSLSDPLLNELPSLGRQHLMNILNTLDRGQKEWLLISIYELAHCDGSITPIEIKYSAGIAADIGFTENQYLSLIQKTSHLRK